MFSKFSKQFFTQNVKRSVLNPIVFDYNKLKNKEINLYDQIYEAYGENGAGIAFIRNVPNYQQYRQALLPLGKKLGSLPDEILTKYEKPESLYSVGVNRAKLKTTKYTDNSISFFASPVRDIPEDFAEGRAKNTSFPNVWPREDLPQLESAFKNLGSLIYDVGLTLAYHLDKYVKNLVPEYEEGKIKRVISTVNGRLIHYPDQPKEKTKDDDWVFWHCDWSEITCLTSPMYIDKDHKPLDLKDSFDSGLEIIKKDGSVCIASIPTDCLAIQTGECVQIHTGGKLVATPHRVFQGPEMKGRGITRNQFVCFFNPQYTEKMSVPPGMKYSDAIILRNEKIPALEKRWKGDETYREFNDFSYQQYVNPK
jgi:isopenicillin N synthase-like dioxygenase